ncbi:MAG TPA: hypothetical protein VMP68_23690 [Candidatus Eisenbacteria bacterium]|nr:hypothetical protein [Candidatus Eisenbacteria bacterium]
MLKSPKLREARFDDHARITALAAKYGLRTEEYSAWTHLWNNNPAYRSVQGQIPIGWVLDIGGDEIVGYLGNVPIGYVLRGKRLLAATTRAWVVDTPYRAYSPLLLATYFQQRNVDFFLSTTVNSQSEAAYSSFQSTRVPIGSWDRASFWITNYRGFVASYLRRRGSFAGAASYPLAGGLFALDQLRGSRLPRPDSSSRIAACTRFDDRFDAFWQSLSRVKSNILLADRSLQSLDWHFKSAFQKRDPWIYVAERGSSIMAYSIFQRYDFAKVGLTRVRLIDFQCLDSNKALDVLLPMLRTAIGRCRKGSIHMLELVGDPFGLMSKLPGVGLRQRPLGSWLYFYKANNASLAQELQNSSIWEPCLFDGDSSL